MNFAIESRRALHQIPELGFQEYKTQALLEERIRLLGSDRVELERWRTGLFVRVRGSVGTRTIGYRADMDGLPIVEETGLSFTSLHPGCMHACGHDVHMAVALGLIERAVRDAYEDDFVVLFQPAEEGPGGAEPMVNAPAFERFRPDVLYALHVAPEYEVGVIASRPGVLFASARELHIFVHGVSGHGAFPHRGNDVVIVQAALVLQLQTIVSRNVNPMGSAVVSIGQVQAGTKENVIADYAELHGTVRALSDTEMVVLEKRIEEIVDGVARTYGVTIDLKFGNRYHEVVNDADHISAFREHLETRGWTYETCEPAMTAEDFGYMLKHVPGFMVWLGVGNPASGLHRSDLQPDERAISFAIDVFDDYIRHVSR